MRKDMPLHTALPSLVGPALLCIPRCCCFQGLLLAN